MACVRRLPSHYRHNLAAFGSGWDDISTLWREHFQLRFGVFDFIDWDARIGKRESQLICHYFRPINGASIMRIRRPAA